jgi:hypothetical protein
MEQKEGVLGKPEAASRFHRLQCPRGLEEHMPERFMLMLVMAAEGWRQRPPPRCYRRWAGRGLAQWGPWKRVFALLLLWVKQSSARVVDVEEASVFPCKKVPKEASHSTDRR